ncbi:MAG: response regulator [Gammaproteobacteria bacterium]
MIVDGDDEKAMSEWRALCDKDPAKATLPTVMVSREVKLANPTYYHLRRPVIATRVLSTLDQIAVKEMNYLPEMMIGADNSMANPAAEALLETVRQRATPTQSGTQHTALVVDDSLPVRKQIELELGLSGIKADLADSGEQAFELLNNKSYDLIFLDVILPGVDGYKICKTIKKDRFKKRIPVIMLTGKGSPFDRVRGKLAGCDSYLTKPVAHESFQAVVRKYLPQTAPAR